MSDSKKESSSSLNLLSHFLNTVSATIAAAELLHDHAGYRLQSSFGLPSRQFPLADCEWTDLSLRDFSSQLLLTITNLEVLNGKLASYLKLENISGQVGDQSKNEFLENKIIEIKGLIASMSNRWGFLIKIEVASIHSSADENPEAKAEGEQPSSPEQKNDAEMPPIDWTAEDVVIPSQIETPGSFESPKLKESKTRVLKDKPTNSPLRRSPAIYNLGAFLNPSDSTDHIPELDLTQLASINSSSFFASEPDSQPERLSAQISPLISSSDQEGELFSTASSIPTLSQTNSEES